MKVKTFPVNPIQENCYVIWDEASLEAAIIDCGAWEASEEREISAFISDNQLKLVYSLQTHMHFDHAMGLPFLKREYGLRPLCHGEEQQVYDMLPEMARMFGIPLSSDMPGILRYLEDGEKLKLGETEIEVIHTPGHTPGGVCFYIEKSKMLFCGDTLFQGSLGRTDLPGGNMQKELQSISQRLFVLNEETKAYPGHGPSTSIGREKRTNPYF